MQPQGKYDIAIVGAGITGLTLGQLLTERGFKVLIIEREQTIGGLARSFIYPTGVFDIGPHRFHTDQPAVETLIRSVLAQEAITISRRSSVHFYGLRHPWPIRLRTVLRLPLKFLCQAFFDLFTRPRFTPDMKSFAQYVTSKYGKTLYNLFFHDYSLKFCRIPPDRLHCDWAMTGVDRAIIDKRLQMNNLFDTLRMSLLPKPVQSLFIYPRQGCQVFADRLAANIRRSGGTILTGTDIARIHKRRRHITSIDCRDKRFHVKRLVWTGDIHDLVRLLGWQDADLPYLNMVLFNIITRRDPGVPDQWVYYGEKELSFTRISFPHNFSPYLFPAGHFGLCVEVTVKDPRLWQEPEAFQEQVLADVSRLDLVAPNDISAIHIEKITNAYPIYHIHYRRELDIIRRQAAEWPNLYLSGRTGSFFYNNMDNSIDMAQELSLRIAEDAGKE